ncbi:hypothetical protein AB0M39_08215 [Streptomyces sp. NPDC051907]|uniref:hypothetical protein n=1 Tax=Streptomyces sp. NPDC051907 TaxID=3155284 RepID=UPI00341262D7
MLDSHRPAQRNPESSPAPAPRSPRPRMLAGAGIGGVVVLAAALNGAPGWALATILLGGLAVVLVQSALHALIPQESGDRLAWWIDRRDQRSRRRRALRCRNGPEERPPCRESADLRSEERRRGHAGGIRSD